MRPDDGALAERDDLFEFVPSPAKTISFMALAGVMIAVALLCLLNLDAINSWGAENASGRRARAIGPYLAYVGIALGVVFGIWSAVSGVRTGRWQLKSGQVLKRQIWNLEAASLDDVHQRLATGDPSVYLPLPVARQANQVRTRLRGYNADGVDATWLTVTAGVGKNARHWPLITFEGQTHTTFQQVRNRLGKPYQG